MNSLYILCAVISIANGYYFKDDSCYKPGYDKGVKEVVYVKP